MTRIHSGRTGQELFVLPGLGARPAGDIDGDGVRDVLVDFAAYSGRTGAFLRSQSEVLVMGDVDGDGIDDYLGGEPNAGVSCAGGKITSWIGGQGSMRVASGKDGATLFQAFGSPGGDAFGGLVAPIGDVDGDGAREVVGVAAVLAGSHSFSCPPVGDRYVRAYSPVSGVLLWQVPGAPTSIVALDDVDGDGAPDLAFGDFFSSTVELRSGVTGAVIRTLVRPGLDRFGAVLQTVDDLDGEGCRELVAAAPQPTPVCIGSCGPGTPPPVGPGYVEVLSSRDDSVLARFAGTQPAEEYGRNLASAGDVNADGVPDLVLGTTGKISSNGAVEVLSTRPLSLRSATHEVSLSTGGLQVLPVDAGAVNAGRLALLLGSASGTRPGIQLGAVRLPLNYDGYMQALFTGTSPIQPSSILVVLDAQGRGGFDLGIPAGLPPALVGRTVAHALVTFDLGAL
ncbi:MAG: hypothetical protein L0227_18760, partial [Chloroflexi bacterium]|nr:hypothetical protein [Chloroflexota bacterium]